MLNILSKSPNFQEVQGFDLILIELMEKPISEYQKEEFLERLKNSPRAYLTFEKQLFQVTPFFDTLAKSPLDFIEETADRLFHETLE